MNSHTSLHVYQTYSYNKGIERYNILHETHIFSVASEIKGLFITNIVTVYSNINA